MLLLGILVNSKLKLQQGSSQKSNQSRSKGRRGSGRGREEPFCGFGDEVLDFRERIWQKEVDRLNLGLRGRHCAECLWNSLIHSRTSALRSWTIIQKKNDQREEKEENELISNFEIKNRHELLLNR